MSKRWVFIFAGVLIVLLYGCSLNQENITGRQVQGFINVQVIGSCKIDLEQGWNLISSCALANNNTIKSFFSQIEGDYQYILEWDHGAQDFEIYAPYEAVPAFTDLNLNYSYFILFRNPTPTRLYVSGSYYDDVMLNLVHGWNTPTYPYFQKTNISAYLDPLGTNNYRYLMRWNKTDQDFMIFSPLSAVPTFDKITRGEGQFMLIKPPGGATLYYNKSNLGT